jgi:hypothetical protein
MTYVPSPLSPALRERAIEDVKVDWERFATRVRPIDLVEVAWETTAAGDPCPQNHACPGEQMDLGD